MTKHDGGRKAAEVWLALHDRGVNSVNSTVFAAAQGEFGNGFNITALRNARRVLVDGDRQLLERVSNGELTLYFAFEMVTEGVREVCTTCGGAGHIHVPYQPVKRRRRRRSGAGGGA